MAKILHVVGTFDPAGDVVRCVDELRRYSGHEHRLIVREVHPFQNFMWFKEAETQQKTLPDRWAKWPDAVLCHFVGWPDEWPKLDVPMGFRNLNIRYNAAKDEFWTEKHFNFNPLKANDYKFVGASHVGAKDFLGEEKFRWLPDLLPLTSPYEPDYTPRPHCVSYIKQNDEFDGVDFGLNVTKLNLHFQPHPVVLARRRAEATIVIDNTIDGHWGLAGHEALLLGLPCFAFLHEKTELALREYADDSPPPFALCRNGKEVIENIRALTQWPDDKFLALRGSIRGWAEKYFDPNRLIATFWDTFFAELTS